MHKLMHHPMLQKCCNRDLGILLIRLAVGGAFIFHGLQKFQNMDGTIGFFSTLGLAPFFAYLVAGVETVGGIALVLGVVSSVAAVLLAIIMIVAIILVKWGMAKQMGFGAMEIDVVLLGATLGLSMIGAGKYALMRGCCSGNTCGSDCAGCTDCKVGADGKTTCDGCGSCSSGGCTNHEGK